MSQKRRGAGKPRRPFWSRSPCLRERQTRSRSVVGGGRSALLAAESERAAQDARIGADLGLDLARHVGVLAEEVLRRLAPLADAGAVIGVPGARFLHDPGLDAEVDELAGL